jgi:hypothetical protein
VSRIKNGDYPQVVKKEKALLDLGTVDLQPLNQKEQSQD